MNLVCHIIVELLISQVATFPGKALPIADQCIGWWMGHEAHDRKEPITHRPDQQPTQPATAHFNLSRPFPRTFVFLNYFSSDFFLRNKYKRSHSQHGWRTLTPMNTHTLYEYFRKTEPIYFKINAVIMDVSLSMSTSLITERPDLESTNVKVVYSVSANLCDHFHKYSCHVFYAPIFARDFLSFRDVTSYLPSSFFSSSTMSHVFVASFTFLMWLPKRCEHPTTCFSPPK